ncbi:MAG: SixA phosphatase family protein [Solirubrobacterales bacterium]
MKRLYLLRHAKSSWDDPTLADHDRPLAPRGRRAARVIAEHLRRKGVAPELVLCSPSRRTRQTLRRIAPGLGENADVRIESELYAASAADLIEVLQEVPDEVKAVMLIGHNPGIQDLAVSLARGGSEIARVRSKFPTAALATLELNGSWRELSPGSAELVSLVKPKELSRGAAGGA